jgi:prohibitin 1
MKRTVLLLALAMFSSGCSIVYQNQIGIKRTLGKVKTKELAPGAYLINPFLTRVIKLPANTVNLEVKLDLPSKEGLTVNSEISILYRIKDGEARNILTKTGRFYEQEVILSVFRSASADVCARFNAKDMHSGARAEIENEIQKRMTDLLSARGFEVEAVLMKSIRLPAGLASSIEAKLSAEQDALRMEFILKQERLEAERRIIEAEGIKAANEIISKGLTKEVLSLRSIEAFKELSQSPNAKVIVTDGKTPLIVDR